MTFTHIILEDIISHSKGNIYAKKGEKVRIISQSGNVCIVESESGVRFPLKNDKIISIK